MRFLHTADWQIGMTRHFLDDDAQSRFTADREKAIRTMAQLVQEQEAAFVVVAGDVFDANLLKPRTVMRALDALGEFRVPVFLLPGNHDALNAISIYRTPDFLRHKPPGVHVLDSHEMISVNGGVEVVGVPLVTHKPSRDEVSEAALALPPCGTGVTRVMVAHGQASTLSFGSTAVTINIEAVEQAMEEGRLHYLALGDRHSTTSVGRLGRIWFSGSPEPTDYDETESGNALIVDVSPETVRVNPVSVGVWKFSEHHLNLLPGHAVEQVKEELDAHLGRRANTILRLTFEGTVGIQEKIWMDALVEEARGPFGAIERPFHHDNLVVLPDAQDRETLDLTGFAQQTFERLYQEAQAPNAPPHAQNALALFYRLAGDRA